MLMYISLFSARHFILTTNITNKFKKGNMSDKPESANYSPSKSQKSSSLWLIILAVIVLCGLSFYGGVAYEKGHNHTVASTAAKAGFNGGGYGGRFSGQRPNIGDVTAVSSSSITITSSMSGSSETFSITSSTTFTDNGQTSSVSDIQTGDTVLIRTSSSSSTTATSIDINPSFGGYGGQSSNGSSSSSGTDDSTGSNDDNTVVTN
jgi:hypothetical protein